MEFFMAYKAFINKWCEMVSKKAKEILGYLKGRIRKATPFCYFSARPPCQVLCLVLILTL